MSKNFAHLKPESPFYDVFPGGRVPIQNILVPQLGVMEGDRQNQPQEFYRVDVAQLAPEQFETICRRVAEQCGGTRFEVASAVKRDGFIPLRAIHVSGVSTDSMAFL